MLQHLRGLPAVDDGNGDVHQDQIGLFGARLRDAFLAIQRLRHCVAEVSQDRGIDDAVVFVVLDEQDSFSVRGHACPHTVRTWIGSDEAGRCCQALPDRLH